MKNPYLGEPRWTTQGWSASKLVEFLGNFYNNKPKNASALYTSNDASHGGTHIKNPKPSQECTYSVINFHKTFDVKN